MRRALAPFMPAVAMSNYANLKSDHTLGAFDSYS